MELTGNIILARFLFFSVVASQSFKGTEIKSKESMLTQRFTHDRHPLLSLALLAGHLIQKNSVAKEHSHLLYINGTCCLLELLKEP